MTLLIEADTTPLNVDETGTVRVAATRVTLDTIVARFLCGDMPEVIAVGFPSLSLGEIYQVIAYYLQHREQVDAYLAERRTQADALRDEVNAYPPMRALRERLLAQKTAKGL